MAAITFIRPYLYEWGFYKIDVYINTVHVLALDNGDEQTIELEEGDYMIHVNGFSMKSAMKNLSIKKEEKNKNVYVFLNFLSKGKFHEKTHGLFLIIPPLGISEKPYKSTSNSDNWRSLPIFQSVWWLVLMLCISLIPAIVEFVTARNIHNLIILFPAPLFLLLSISKNKKFLTSKHFFCWEPYFVGLLLLFTFLFQENLQRPTMIACLLCAMALLIVFVVKYILNKRKTEQMKV